MIVAIIVGISLYYVRKRWFKNKSFKFIREAFSNWFKRVFGNRRARQRIAQSPESQELSSPDSTRPQASHKYNRETEGIA